MLCLEWDHKSSSVSSLSRAVGSVDGKTVKDCIGQTQFGDSNQAKEISRMKKNNKTTRFYLNQPRILDLPR